MPNTPTENKLPLGQAQPASLTADDADSLQARIDELESLCGDLYEAAVEIGLPQVLLNRLWTVAARGNAPHSFDLELPPAVPAASPTPTPPPSPAPLPDVRLVHRPQTVAGGASRASLEDLAPLPERRTVMIVDDDSVLLELIVRILSRENYDILTASSGLSALEQLEKTPVPIDLLVTDYVMPGMNGRQLAERVRRRFPDVKVLHQTGFSDLLFDDCDEIEPGSAFLEKPFSARGLLEAARLLLFETIHPDRLQRTA